MPIKIRQFSLVALLVDLSHAFWLSEIKCRDQFLRYNAWTSNWRWQWRQVAKERKKRHMQIDWRGAKINERHSIMHIIYQEPLYRTKVFARRSEVMWCVMVIAQLLHNTVRQLIRTARWHHMHFDIDSLAKLTKKTKKIL